MGKTKLVRGILTAALGVAALAMLALVIFLVYKAGIWGAGHERMKFPGDGGADAKNYPLLGVMLENHFHSWPFQAGLSQAAVVYEAPTEANITRFLAIFLHSIGTAGNPYPAKFGPIRSSRGYFLNWMHEYDGTYVHVGGRHDALARLQREKIVDVDQFVYDKYFWRENTARAALEHTMFTSGEKMQELIKEKNWVFGKAAHPFLEKHERAPDLSGYPETTKLVINFGSPTYTVNYEYDAESRRYLRSQAGQPHMDTGTDTQLEAASVVVQRVRAWSNNDAAGSISMETLGSGDAQIFQRGRAITGTWKKNSLKEPTKFFDETGDEISFFAGPIWVEIVPFYNKVEIAAP